GVGGVDAGSGALDEDAADGEAVDADRGRPFAGERLGQVNQAGLGGAIVDHTRQPATAGGAGNVDDRAAALGPHRRRDGTTAVEGAGGVDVGRAGDLGGVNPGGGAPADGARVVDQDIDAPEAFEGGARDLRDLGLVGDIGRHRQGPPAQRLDLGGGRLDFG